MKPQYSLKVEVLIFIETTIHIPTYIFLEAYFLIIGIMVLVEPVELAEEEMQVQLAEEEMLVQLAEVEMLAEVMVAVPLGAVSKPEEVVRVALTLVMEMIFSVAVVIAIQNKVEPNSTKKMIANQCRKLNFVY